MIGGESEYFLLEISKLARKCLVAGQFEVLLNQEIKLIFVFS